MNRTVHSSSKTGEEEGEEQDEGSSHDRAAPTIAQEAKARGDQRRIQQKQGPDGWTETGASEGGEREEEVDTAFQMMDEFFGGVERTLSAGRERFVYTCI